MTGKIEAPFVFGVRVEGDTFTDRHEETERLKANFTYSPTEFAEPTENDCRKIFSHRFHRFPQIRRVWHPAIPTPPSEVLPQNSQNSQKFLAQDVLPQISQIPT